MTVGIRSIEERRLASYPTFGGKEKHALDIEEHRILIEMLPIKHTPKFRDVFFSVRGHYMDASSAR